MAQTVKITPASGLLEFIGNTTTNKPYLQHDDNGNLTLTLQATKKFTVAGNLKVNGKVTMAQQTLTDGAAITWDFNSGANAKVTIAGARTLVITNMEAGDTGLILVKQDAAGSRTLTLPGSSSIVGGGSYTASSAANATDVLGVYYDGTTYWWTIGYNTVTPPLTSVGITGSDFVIANSPLTSNGNIGLTLATVNSNVGTFGSATAVPVITVNAKGLVTAVSATNISIPTNLDSLTDVTISSAATGQLLQYNGSQWVNWTPNYVQTSRSLTINGTAYDLSADRSWSVGTVTSVGGTGTVSGLTLSGTVTGSGNLTLGGTLTLTSGNVTDALGYTPYNVSNPAGYITSAALGNYVTYTGATADLNIGTFGLISDYVRFNLSSSNIPSTPGTLSWNDVDGTLDLKLKGGNVTLQIGQEQLVRIVNDSGGDLLESQYHVVFIKGAQGSRLKAGLAIANNTIDSKATIGMVTENIQSGNEGFVTSSGLVHNIDTTGSMQGENWSNGDVLWLSAVNPGHVTNVQPTGSFHKVVVGYVTNAHPNNGTIYVKISVGTSTWELNNVSGTQTANNGDIFKYNSANGVWEAGTIAGVLGYTPANDSNVVHKTGAESIAGVKTFTDTTQSTSITSGGLVTNGGVGIAKNLYVGGNINVVGNLTIGGTTTTINAQNLSVSDNMIYLNNGISTTITNVVANGTIIVYTTAETHNYSTGMSVSITGCDPTAFNLSNQTITAVTTNSFTIASAVTGSFVSGGTARAKSNANPDIGFAGGYNSGTYGHTGLFRDATDDTFKFFKGYTPEPDASPFIDVAHASFAYADVRGSNITGTSFIKSGGTSSQFLKADGSIDSTVYASTAGSYANPSWITSLNYAKITGGTSSQFVKADGSVDSTSYLSQSAAAATYQPLGSYLTAEADTLATVTGRGASTATNITLSGGILTLSNATSNRINYGTTGVAIPQFSTYSAGTKIVLYDNIGVSSVGYTIGISSGVLWTTVPDTTNSFRWYGGTTTAATLTGAGALTTTGSITASSIIKSGGTSSQFLKADGSVDSSTYLTSYTDTLATVTARGATTAVATSFTGGASISNLLINGAAAYTEGSLALGAQGADEGGQFVLNKATSHTFAAHVDVWRNLFRVLYGTNAASAGTAMSIDLSTRQLILPAYQTPTSFTGTAAGVLAFDSVGNIITIAVPGGAVTSVNAGTGVSVNSTTGAVTVSIGQSVATSASPTFSQVLTTSNGGGTNVKLGDDVWIGDVNVANTMGIVGQQNSDRAYITFGSDLTTALGRITTGDLTWGVNRIWHAGNLTNLNQLTNGPGYITGYTETDTLQTVTARGATTSIASSFTGGASFSGGANITGLTITKSGTDSTITFPAQLNDPGYIKHYESNNVAIMYFNVSDDSNDNFYFGYSGAPDSFILRSDGVITKGTWQGSAITDSYISSAATWNAKQAALSGSGIVKSASGTISYISGTSAQFIKGDGSLDSSTYLTTGTASSTYLTISTASSTYLPLAGGTITGKVTFPSTFDRRPQFPGGILGLNVGDGDFDIWGISTEYYPSHATAANAWGLRWNGTNNDFEFVGGGTNRVILDMDGGNLTITGTITASGYNKSNWDSAYNDTITTAAVSGTTTKTLTLTQRDGGTVTASWTDIDTDTNTDAQTLSLSGSTLSISGGNSITLPTGGISQGTADSLYVNVSGDEMTGNLYVSPISGVPQIQLAGTNPEFYVSAKSGTARAFINRAASGNQATLMFTTGMNVFQGTAWDYTGVPMWTLGMTNNNNTDSFKIAYGDIYDPVSVALEITSANIAYFKYVPYGGGNLLATQSWVTSQGYITGVTNISGYSTNLYSQDIRTISPSSHSAYRLNFGFTSWSNNNTSPWADYLHLRSYSDASGGLDNLIMFKKTGGIGMRIWQQTWGSATAYSSYVDIIHSSNIGSYAWTSSNDGAGSGLDADLLDGYNSDTAANVNTIVRRDSSGNIYSNYVLGTYFNASQGNSENPTIGQIWTQNTSDNYLRKSTPSHFRSQITDSYYLSLSGGTVSGNVNLTGQLAFLDGSSGYSNIIRSAGYPSEGYPDGSNYWLEYRSWGGHHFVLNTDGGIGAGLAAPDDFVIWQGAIDGDRLLELSNTGTLTIADRLIELSSIRYKTNVESLTPALDKVLQLRPVYYTKIGGTGSTEIGLIAEEVAEIYPELIKYDDAGQVDGINYTRIAPILIKTIQEQQELIKNLTKRIDDLENR